MAKLRAIRTPRGVVKHIRSGNGSVTAVLVWSPGFGAKMNIAFMGAQEYIDAEVLRLSNMYAPQVSSMLQKLGVLGTEIGSGEVAWIAPYSHFQYTLYSRKTSQNINPKFDPNEPKWFERAWAIHGEKIMEGVNARIRKGMA